jgi:hypothetical protein
LVEVLEGFFLFLARFWKELEGHLILFWRFLFFRLINFERTLMNVLRGLVSGLLVSSLGFFDEARRLFDINFAVYIF